MNEKKLHQAQLKFLNKYPGGFLHPEMQEIGKKHKMDQMIELTQESFSKANFREPRNISQSMIKIVSRSSMISMFEKPKLKEFINALNQKQRSSLSHALKNQLHGNQEDGFETMVNILKPAKLAKWSLITILPNYYFPNDEVFIKPTTTKAAIQYFELENLVYKPTPTWAFYTRYKTEFLKMKNAVDASVAPNNAAFGGFLMMSVND